MTQGIDLVWFRQKLGINFLETFKDVIADLEKKNYIIAGATHIALTQQGRAFLDSIASLFVDQDVPSAGSRI